MVELAAADEKLRRFMRKHTAKYLGTSRKQLQAIVSSYTRYTYHPQSRQQVLIAVGGDHAEREIRGS